MGMAIDFDVFKKRKKFHLYVPIIAQIISVIIGFICDGLIIEAIIQDDKYNHKLMHLRLPQLVDSARAKNGTELIHAHEIKNLLLRNAPMKKGYCLIVGFACLVTIVHLFIYREMKTDVYRYKFTIQLNALLAFLYAVAGGFLLISVLQNDYNYGHLYRLIRARGVYDDPTQNTTLYYYRYCQVNTGTRDEDQVPPIPGRFKNRIHVGLGCQHFTYKMVAVLLAFSNVFFFAVVMLTVRSSKEEIKKAIDRAKDLDVEPWMWTDPDGTRAFINEYIYQQEKAKYIMEEIDEEPEKPKHLHHFKKLNIEPTHNQQQQQDQSSTPLYSMVQHM